MKPRDGRQPDPRPRANERGFRAEVLAPIPRTRRHQVRHAGGTSSRDFAGETASDPRGATLAWFATAGIKRIMAVNLGGRGEGSGLSLDYANGSAPTILVQQRRANSHAERYGGSV